MPELRWILLLLGLLLIAAVYFIGRRRQHKPPQRFEPHLPADVDGEAPHRAIGGDDAMFAADRDPFATGSDPFAAGHETFGTDRDPFTADPRPQTQPSELEALVDVTEPQPVIETEPAPEQAPAAATAPSDARKIVAVRVAARASTRFRAEDVIRLLHEEGLEFGKFEIFHRTAGGTNAEPVFSVASMVEPGTFDLHAKDSSQLPGVTLFLVLPGPRDGVAALDDMLATARRLAEQLNGEVLDQSGSTLSRQRASNLRDEIIAFQHHLAIQQRQAPAGKGRRRFL